VDDERRNLVHAAVQKPGDPSTKRDKTWGAHERLAIRRPRAFSPTSRSSSMTIVRTMG